MTRLRIVGGALGGRRFSGPRGGATVRPTSERVREAVASALEARDAFDGAAVLDLFAGTGALAFEALSRGAERATLADRDRRLVRSLERVARELDLGDRCAVRCVDLLGDPARACEMLAPDGPFTLLFADPPYAEVAKVPPLLQALVAGGVLAPGAWVALEHAVQQPPPHLPLASVARYRYGGTAVVLGTVPSLDEERLPT